MWFIICIVSRLRSTMCLMTNEYVTFAKYWIWLLMVVCVSPMVIPYMVLQILRVMILDIYVLWEKHFGGYRLIIRTHTIYITIALLMTIHHIKWHHVNCKIIRIIYALVLCYCWRIHMIKLGFLQQHFSKPSLLCSHAGYAIWVFLSFLSWN